MPTGYTWDVANGNMTEAKDYILRCARAFGATIMMRDDPLDKPIPEFQPNSYHREAMEAAKRKIDELYGLTIEHIQERIDVEYWHELDCNKKYRQEKIDERNRYSGMLSKVEKWQPPSPEHCKLKEFCIDQLNECLKHEFSDKDLDEYYPIDLEKPTIEKWLEDKIKEYSGQVEYHQKKHNEEVERTNERNNWINQLKDSLETL